MSEQYEIVLQCATCGEELNRTKPGTADELMRSWTAIAISGVFMGKWNHSHSTYHDANLNTKRKLARVSDGKEFACEYAVLKNLAAQQARSAGDEG